MKVLVLCLNPFLDLTLSNMYKASNPEPEFRFHKTKGAPTPSDNKPNSEVCSHSNNLLNHLQVQILGGFHQMLEHESSGSMSTPSPLIGGGGCDSAARSPSYELAFEAESRTRLGGE